MKWSLLHISSVSGLLTRCWFTFGWQRFLRRLKSSYKRSHRHAWRHRRGTRRNGWYFSSLVATIAFLIGFEMPKNRMWHLILVQRIFILILDRRHTTLCLISTLYLIWWCSPRIRFVHFTLFTSSAVDNIDHNLSSKAQQTGLGISSLIHSGTPVVFNKTKPAPQPQSVQGKAHGHSISQVLKSECEWFKGVCHADMSNVQNTSNLLDCVPHQHAGWTPAWPCGHCNVALISRCNWLPSNVISLYFPYCTFPVKSAEV